MRGTVISVHVHGATARLEDGTLVAITVDELAANRQAYVASRDRRRPLELRIARRGRHSVAFLGEAPPGLFDEPQALATDLAFELRLGAYLKATEEWAPPDRPAPAERHFIRKKRRAETFEARKKTT
jgi:hypothetical protein